MLRGTWLDMRRDWSAYGVCVVVLFVWLFTDLWDRWLLFPGLAALSVLVVAFARAVGNLVKMVKEEW